MLSKADPNLASLLNSSIVDAQNMDGKSHVLLVCEHASNYIPAKYNALGLTTQEIQSHIAWDPGAMKIAGHLVEMLDAPLIAQKVSRLVYDCNRPPNSPDAMRPTSEAYSIPGNQNLTDSEKQTRIAEVYTPFRTALRQTIDQRIKAGFDPIIITIHSFTPTYNGTTRDVEIGILHDSDQRIADAMLKAANGPYDVRRNAPYGPQDGVTHTLTDQAISRGLRNVMIEIRNDLLKSADSQHEIAQWLAALIKAAILNEAAICQE